MPPAAGSAARLKAAVTSKPAPAPSPTIDTETGEIASEQHARTLDQYRADLDSATDAEVASLILDAAREDLYPTDHAELVEHWRGRWGAE